MTSLDKALLELHGKVAKARKEKLDPINAVFPDIQRLVKNHKVVQITVKPRSDADYLTINVPGVNEMVYGFCTKRYIENSRKPSTDPKEKAEYELEAKLLRIVGKGYHLGFMVNRIYVTFKDDPRSLQPIRNPNFIFEPTMYSPSIGFYGETDIKGEKTPITGIVQLIFEK